MRTSAFAAIIGFAVYGCQASAINLPVNWPDNWFDNWFGTLDHFPENPCEWVGGTCDTFVRESDFCVGKHDAKIDLPCGPLKTTAKCCWHKKL
ncbi:hypothetical protein HDV63DRAFT_374370 [Trichoderma sp. SZMC 28014]